MPTVDSAVDTDREREKELREADRHDRGDKKQKSTSSATKSKDLSHVPCKFFKVGACTAGSSCPFSHASAEPGAQKEPCAWFVKGNCKFGHKCALAHVLPGQSMSMDRKNKKAAQQAAAASAGAASGGGDKSGAGSKEGRKKREGHSGNSPAPPGRNNTLLAGGSTAPTRLLSSTSTTNPSSNRPPMPLKASISPSAPAPPLKDTDFASFAALDEMEGVHQLPVPPAHGKSSAAQEASGDVGDSQAKDISTPSPVPLPTSAPRVTTAMTPSEFGPIGSPPSASTRQQSASALNNNGSFTPGTSPRGPSHLNGVNLGTSPQTGGFMSSSPFSAPGTQSVFMNNSYAGHGVAASLGSGLAMMGGRRGWGDVDVSASPAKPSGLSMLSSSVQRTSLLNNGGNYSIDIEYDNDLSHPRKMDSAVEDENMEEFIPGSLTDLLTPEERSRRMSRSGSSGRPHVSGLTAGAPSNDQQSQPPGIPAPVPQQQSTSRMGHRYSSSVPATSLLGDLKSIWSDTAGGLPSSPSTQAQLAHGGHGHPLPHTPSHHRATPSASFASRFDGLSIGGQQQGSGEDMGMSMSMGSTSSIGMLSPSNASAAFLGLHHNYLKSKASTHQPQLGFGGTTNSGLGGQGAGGVGVGGLSRGFRGASGPLYPGAAGGAGTTTGNLSATNSMGFSSNANQGYPASANAQSTFSQLPSYRGAPSPFDLTQPMHQAHHNPNPNPPSSTTNSARPTDTSNGNKRLGNIGLGFANSSGLGMTLGVAGAGGAGAGNGAGGLGGAGGPGYENDIISGQFLSPNTRALQAHAPGQSLPQGLAAGYSRIHALPPLSGGMGGFVSPGASAGLSGSLSGGGMGGGMSVGGFDSTGAGVNVGTAPIREEWGDSSLPPQTASLLASGLPPRPPTATTTASTTLSNESRNATPAPRTPSTTTNPPSALAPHSSANANASQGYVSGVPGASPGLESVLSKLSYSAAAKGAPSASSAGVGGGVEGGPPGLSKGRYTPSALSASASATGTGTGGSPLRPREDDDLFSMDDN